VAWCPKGQEASVETFEDVDIRSSGPAELIGAPKFNELLKEKVLLDDVDTEDSTTADTGQAGASSPVGRLTAPEDVAVVDFSGSWVCTRVTGDMASFMKDAGLDAAMREAARAASYGAGRQVQNIAQVGDAMVVQNILKEPVATRFRVGAGLQSALDQDGKLIYVDPWWDGDALCVVSRREDKAVIAHSRRYFDGATMVLELFSPKGARVRRVFERS